MKARMLTPMAVLLAVAASPAFAQTERSGNADARIMQQLQQMSSERAALQADNAKLKQELDQLKKDLQQAASAKASLENRNKALTANASRGEQSVLQTEEQLERARDQMQELVTRFRETAQSLRDVEIERADVKSQLALRDREFKTCVDRNAAFYNLNVEVLDRMENRGLWSNLTAKEPFLKLKRVELENLVDDYRYRADELKLEQQKQASADK